MAHFSSGAVGTRCPFTELHTNSRTMLNPPSSDYSMVSSAPDKLQNEHGDWLGGNSHQVVSQSHLPCHTMSVAKALYHVNMRLHACTSELISFALLLQESNPSQLISMPNLQCEP